MATPHSIDLKTPRIPPLVASLLQLGGWFVLIAILKHDRWLAPPAWDSVMGVFPPAVFLFEHGFDAGLLLQQGDWWQGGPNVHSLSLFTWLVAGVMVLARDPQVTFLLLHGLTFLLTALSLWWLVGLLRALGVSTPVATMAALALLLCPLVLVQVERLYTEIPLMACHAGVALSLCRGSPKAAVLVALVALSIKLTAVALVAGLVLVLAANLRSAPGRTIAEILVLLLGAGLILAAPGLLGAAAIRPGGWGDPALLLSQLELRLETVWDITLLMQAAIMAAAILPLWWWHSRARGRGRAQWTMAAMLCLLVPVLFSAGVVAGAYRGNLFLPRYLVAVLPLAIVSVVLLAREFLPRWAQMALPAICAVYFVLNHDGRFYPPNHDSFSVVERSLAYREFNAVKVRALDALGERDPAVPAFVTREMHYMNSNRFMGYADPVHAMVYPVFNEPYRSLSLAGYPDRFVLLKGSAIHGGRVIDRLVDAARNSAGYKVREDRFESSGFVASLYDISRLE